MTVLVLFSSGELKKHPRPQDLNFLDRRLSHAPLIVYMNQLNFLMQMQDISLWVSVSLIRL